ncbi:MAG: UDP-N-acetylglucosamine 4-epimerase [Chlamydiales bacterium]|nr:UDP-N-acetylglucosamine 4-epimerase [Chlamydiales bacterium]MCH9619521.1 UDP-N-acetylglucosamine 4-epimerase [Chlamydiales bacterium]MCH9623127.1 UDP-N-acetylglucosamine 4-epimerase [Chlamydiales bacterium]
MPKTIFLTGAAGFIGFHVAQALVRRGDKVIGFDNFNTFYSPQLKRDRAKLLEKEGIEVVEGELTTLKLPKCTHVLHLAAQAGVRYARENPNAYIDSNLTGFIRLLEELKNHPEIPLTYASSSSVYGTNEKIPFSTQDRTDRPANLYAATKKANELLAYSYHHLYGIKTTGLRFFTVYGPWGRPDMAYYSFTKAILEGKPLHLYNEGKMWRDFTYIDDIVAGTIGAIDLAAENEVFNLGNHKTEELLHFVKLLEEGLGKKAEIILEGAKSDEMIKTYADIKDSQEKLGYSPQTSLEKGLPRFIKWYLNYNSSKAEGSASMMSEATIQ